eukprot:IDg13186t1
MTEVDVWPRPGRAGGSHKWLRVMKGGALDCFVSALPSRAAVFASARHVRILRDFLAVLRSVRRLSSHSRSRSITLLLPALRCSAASGP